MPCCKTQAGVLTTGHASRGRLPQFRSPVSVAIDIGPKKLHPVVAVCSDFTHLKAGRYRRRKQLEETVSPLVLRRACHVLLEQGRDEAVHRPGEGIQGVTRTLGHDRPADGAGLEVAERAASVRGFCAVEGSVTNDSISKTLHTSDFEALNVPYKYNFQRNPRSHSEGC